MESSRSAHLNLTGDLNNDFQLFKQEVDIYFTVKDKVK